MRQKFITLSPFRLATCSLQKYPEISCYFDNAIMKILIMMMTFHDNRLFTIITQYNITNTVCHVALVHHCLVMVVVLVSCAAFHSSPIFEATGIMKPYTITLKLTFELEATHGMWQKSTA